MLHQTCSYAVTVTQSAFGVMMPLSCNKLIKGLGLNKHRINLSVSLSGTEFFSLMCDSFVIFKHMLDF